MPAQDRVVGEPGQLATEPGSLALDRDLASASGAALLTEQAPDFAEL